jgi:two-component sensor histidine kinase
VSIPEFTVTSPLTMRLLRRLLLLSLVLILALAGLRAWWEYRQVLSGAGQQLDRIAHTEARPLASSLWDINTEQVTLHVEGIVNLPGISYAAVVDQDRMVAERGTPQDKDVLKRTIPLTRQHEGRTVQLGQLVLQADLAQAHERALNSAYVSLAFSTGMGTMLCLAMFLLTRSMVSRHLSMAAQHFQTQRVSQGALEFRELRMNKKWAGDELDILCLAVNRMQENLASVYAQACMADQEAKSQARFPQENPNPVLRVGARGQLHFANQASQGFLSAIGADPGLPMPEPYGSIARTANATGEVQYFEAEFDGRAYAFAARPIQPDGYVNIYGMDITLRQKAMDSIQRSLAEKEILLKEIHHRVKNNLQIISSLLFLQMEYVSLPQDRELFTESQKRIQAMALVHEELYGAEDFSSVDMREYVPRLTERVLAGADIPVRLECLVDDILLPVTRSIPCGLILNELVMNAVKHAFRPRIVGRDEGFLRVSLRREPGLLVLEVQDNGPGLPQDFDITATPTLGMTLVSSLSDQLGGRVSARNDSEGATFRLEMPEETA